MVEEEDKFLKENPIVFKKYKVKKKLGEGAFGEVYLGQAIENNDYVALKVEPRKIVKPILESEAFLLYSIAGPGIPEVKSFGKVKNYTVLVEPLLGKSLFDIFAENHKEMPMEDVCLIGKQIIDRIQWIHSKYIVHRDIKPDNFLIGKKDPNVIYIIDFGLSKKYRSSATNKHIRFGFTGKLTGTVRFASANALRGGEQSRRDDIESIGYMLVYFMKKRLPWQGITATRKMERYLKIYKMKKNTCPEDLCEGLPPEMTEYIRYAKKLEFEQQPDYKYLRSLFGRMLERIHNTNDQLIFSWIKLTDLPNLKNPINPASRRDSPQSRIYKKIKSSLERERNLSSDSGDSKPGSYQQVFTQVNMPTSNLKVIDKNNNYADSEFESKTDKKLNKKLLKAREGLNTMIANLDVTVDENVVDFENERLKRGSKDYGDYTINSNNMDNINMNYNNIIANNNDFNNTKISLNSKNNNLNSNNLNLNNREFMRNNINHNNDNLEVNTNPINNNNQKNLNNNINYNILDNNSIKNNSNDLSNNPINNINNPLNNINPIDNINNSNISNESKEMKKSHLKKSCAIDGKEFTFSEPIDFKSKLNFEKRSKEIIEESKGNVKNENNENKKIDINDEQKNNINTVLTGNNQYINNDLKEYNNSNNIDNINQYKNRTENKKNINRENTNNKNYYRSNDMNPLNNDMKNINYRMNKIITGNNGFQNKNQKLKQKKININKLNDKNNFTYKDCNPQKINILNKRQQNIINDFNERKTREIINNEIKENFNDINNRNDFKKNNNFIKQNNKKIKENKFPNDNEFDDNFNDILMEKLEINTGESLKKNDKNFYIDYPHSSKNNNLNNNELFNLCNNINNQNIKKKQNFRQLKNNNDLNLTPEDGKMENNNLINQKNLNQNEYNKINKRKICADNQTNLNKMNKNKMMNNYSNVTNINIIEPNESSLNGNERDLNKIHNINIENNNNNKFMKIKINLNNNKTMGGNNNIINKNNIINTNKVRPISPRINKEKIIEQSIPNKINNNFINSQSYNTFQFNNLNNNLINLKNNTNANNIQKGQYQINKKMIPTYITNNTPQNASIIGNYQNILGRVDMNNPNIRISKYEVINPTHIQNNKINNIIGNIGNQYSNTIENKYNNYNNMKFPIGNQLYNYSNSQNY